MSTRGTLSEIVGGIARAVPPAQARDFVLKRTELVLIGALSWDGNRSLTFSKIDRVLAAVHGRKMAARIAITIGAAEVTHAE